jgi:hypothetical protein
MHYQSIPKTTQGDLFRPSLSAKVLSVRVFFSGFKSCAILTCFLALPNHF